MVIIIVCAVSIFLVFIIFIFLVFNAFFISKTRSYFEWLRQEWFWNRTWFEKILTAFRKKLQPEENLPTFRNFQKIVWETNRSSLYWNKKVSTQNEISFRQESKMFKFVFIVGEIKLNSFLFWSFDLLLTLLYMKNLHAQMFPFRWFCFRVVFS